MFNNQFTVALILRLLSTFATIILVVHDAQALHRQFTEMELIQTFGVQKPEHVPEYRLIETHRERHTDGIVKVIRFNAWNTTYVVELKPNHRLISPHIKSVIRGKNETKKFQGLPSKTDFSCHFHGRVVSHGDIRAAISDCRKLMGVIVHDDHFLMLQTLPERIHHAQVERHIVYKREAALINPLEQIINEKFGNQKIRKNEEGDRSDSLSLRVSPLSNWENLKYRYNLDDNIAQNSTFDNVRIDQYPEDAMEEFCDISKSVDDVVAIANAFGIDNTLHLNYTLPSEAKLDSLFIFPQLDPITLEIGLFIDSQLYEHFRREFTVDPDQHLTDFSLALINNVHVLYQQPTLSPNLDIVIVHFEMWKTQPPVLQTELHKNGQAQTLLDSFCRFQAKINPGTDLTDPSHWDHAVLLTGYDIYHTTSSVAGVAPVGRMCDDLFACSLVEGMHLGRSFVLAHEMGHNMGMVHDGVQNLCDKGCCLMSAVNGAGKTTWSSCSVREFNAFLFQLDESGRGNCLRDSATSVATHDHLNDNRLPGQRFTADQQCSYFWGRDYQVEIPNGRSYEDICRILWCGNSGSTISTAHPALEGSWCGGEKWCHEGRCEAWSVQNLPVPKVVDGIWSDWSSAEKHCPITPCQITGSITLKSQLRTCTNPAPNNGGRSCLGANVRGLVCGAAKSICDAFTRQQFGDHLCSAIRDDDIRPDRQLSGVSFLHTTQPCKIWCHVRDSELIRNKGQFPNGSPCGNEQFCVSGLCLNLSCHKKAIVADDSDCPLLPSKKSSKWESWSEWSTCSESCDDNNRSLQKRERKCRLSESECAGKSSEIRACTTYLPKCIKYSMWSVWSNCTAKCGGKFGQQSRLRTCVSGDCDKSLLAESKECINNELCIISEWLDWSEWSECSVTCGHGQRQRRRECRRTKILDVDDFDAVKSKEIDSKEETDIFDNCEGEATVIEPCTLKMCPDAKEEKERAEIAATGASKSKADVEESWTEWMPCSVVCGIGFQLREKRCNGKPCPEKGKQARTCNVQDCSKVLSGAVLSEWSIWSACSKTCGQGYQYRHRKCLNAICSLDETLSEHRRCVQGPCPSWASWQSWSNECASCSVFESRKRQRQCIVKVAFESQEQETPVPQDSCPGAPYELDSCENSCLDRQRQQIIQEIKGRLYGTPIKPIEVNEQSLSFKPIQPFRNERNNAGNYLPWQEWPTCSVSCGQGIRQRVRVCPTDLDCSAHGLSFEVGACFEQTCPTLSQTSFGKNSFWGEWSNWSTCSQSCGGGQQTRTRKCEAALVFLCVGFSKEEKPCNTESCSSTLNQSVEIVKIPEWSEWSKFSKCSCFTLTKFRRRYCKILSPKIQGFCSGLVVQQESCKPVSCVAENGGWSEWSQWSQCSRECGANGHQIRNRMCSNPLPSNRGGYCVGYSFDQRPCDKTELSPVCTKKTVDGEWSDWTQWSDCSDPCLNGQRSRTRYCSNPWPANGGLQCLGSDFELEACSDIKLCIKLSMGNFASNLTIANNVSLGSETTFLTPVDGGFSGWTTWSECSEECGFSFQSRQRVCDAPKPAYGGKACNGITYMTSVCRTNPCHNFVDGQWSEWSVWSNSNCDTNCPNFNGIRTRTRKCTSPAPLNEGFPCFGRSVETSDCLNTENRLPKNFLLSDTNHTQGVVGFNLVCSLISNIKLLEGSAKFDLQKSF